MGQRLVIALGGNAITRPGGRPDIEAQFEQTMDSAQSLVDMFEAGHQIVITHGNGPQVGSTYRRGELAADEVYPLPLEICVASTQGGMGYMIVQCLQNELRHRGHRQDVTAIVTTVEVDPADPAFTNPTKPIGQFYTPQQAKERAAEGFVLRKVHNGQFRRVVASPKPLRILESGAIRKLVDAGEILVACGGGGIPVVHNGRDRFEGVAAVVDKDRASALLASEIDADRLIILTATDKVYIRFGQPDQQAIDTMTVAEARAYLDAGEFPAGSMGPKIDAAIAFLETSRKPDSDVLIAMPESAMDAIAGRAGTRIVR